VSTDFLRENGGVAGNGYFRHADGRDPELVRLVRRYVVPRRRYLKLLHANFLWLPDRKRSAFARRLRADAATITDSDLSVLLSSEWRSRLSASWLIASDRRETFVHTLGPLLVASDLTYQGQGFCVALAAIGDATSAEYLQAYLDRWLPRRECRYDQKWAMAVLILIDERGGTSSAQRYLAPGGAWEEWSLDNTDLDGQARTLRAALKAISD
jgi:hypothetical protein